MGSNRSQGSADRHVSRYLTQEDGKPVGFQADYAEVNAGISVRGAGDHWELSLLERNLTNNMSSFTVPRGREVSPCWASDHLQGFVDRPNEVRAQSTLRF